MTEEDYKNKIKDLEEQLSVCSPMKVCDICWDRKDELIKVYSKALRDIVNQSFNTSDGLCNLKRDDCNNNCINCFKRIAKEAIYGKQ